MQTIQVNMIPAVVCVGNDNHSTIGAIFQPEFAWPPIQQINYAGDRPLPPIVDSIKCCNECDSCKTPQPNLGYCVNKLSTPYHASLNPSQPSIASLLAKAWKAKRMAMKRKGLRSLVSLSLKRAAAAPQPVKRKAEKHCIQCPLLSRRLGKTKFLTVEIPKRSPFPPPLVWKPQSSSPKSSILSGTKDLDHQSMHTYTCL